MPTIKYKGDFEEALVELLRYWRDNAHWHEAIQTASEQLRQAGINSFESLYHLINDDTADITLRKGAISLLERFAIGIRQIHPDTHITTHITFLDKRRAYPPLIHELDHSELRECVLRTLGSLGNRRAIPILTQIALDVDKVESYKSRLWALHGLLYFVDSRVDTTYAHIAFDESETDFTLRGDSIELLAFCITPEQIEPYVNLLKHAQPEIRFWCAYGLTQIMHADLSAYLALIDSVVAHDEAVCPQWWHVGRELAPALEKIYAKKLNLPSDEGLDTQLISPRLEYSDVRELRQVDEPTLRIDPEWLAGQLREKWESVKINIRDPKPESMLLDWLIGIGDTQLMGGLHRDGYGVFLTGQTQAIATFSAWYRSIISADTPLRIYEWAEEGKVVKTDHL